MKTLFFISILILFSCGNSEKRFKIEGIQRNCTKNDFDSRERFLCLKQNESIVRKQIDNQLGKFSINNLKQGNYILEYKNMYGQVCSTEISLKNKNVVNIELCTDKFIDTKEITYFNQIQNDTLTLEFSSSGCFNSFKEKFEFFRKNENLIAKIINEKGAIKTKILSDTDIKKISIFFRKLTTVGNGMEGCSTIDSYAIKMNGKKDLLFQDATCYWWGLDEIEAILK